MMSDLMIPRWSRFKKHFALRDDDLLRDRTYRRLWISILISSFGAQVTLLALPLTAAVLLHASPTQMGLLSAIEIVPFVLFSLPSGVWLDRVRKLPVYVTGELAMALAMASVPLVWWLDQLSMLWLYSVGFIVGFVNTTAGSAAQIVLTQIVPRARLVEAHAKNTLASSTAEVAGPGAAGALIKLTGAPLACLVDAVFLVISALILRGIRIREEAPTRGEQFFVSMRSGLDFVFRHRLLISMAVCVGLWEMCTQMATVVQILFATRTLGLSERGVGLSYVALGFGTIGASALVNRVATRIGPGPTLILGFAICGFGWLCLGSAPRGPWGIALYTFMLFAYGVGAVFVFVNFLSLRQSVTAAPMLGRMTSTMRWLILLPAGPGALMGGWLGEHWGLRAALSSAGALALTLAVLASRVRVIRDTKALPTLAGTMSSALP